MRTHTHTPRTEPFKFQIDLIKQHITLTLFGTCTASYVHVMAHTHTTHVRTYTHIHKTVNIIRTAAAQRVHRTRHMSIQIMLSQFRRANKSFSCRRRPAAATRHTTYIHNDHKRQIEKKKR